MPAHALLGAAAVRAQVGRQDAVKKPGTALALPIKITSPTIGLWPLLG